MSSSGINGSGVMTVADTTYFPTVGYIGVKLNTGANAGSISIIEYTRKTASSFTGCTKIRGVGTPQSGDEIIPFVIS